MTVSKILKRTAIFLLVIVLLVIAAAVTIPYFFKDEILVKIKEEANNTLQANVDFKDVNLSLLRSFPDFSFAMEELSIVGVDEFKDVPFISADNIDFTLDLMSVIKSDRPIEVQSITLNKPDINIIVLNNGKANYDIVESSGESSSSGDLDFLVQLKKYKISEGNFTYDDRAGNIFLKLKNLNHQGNGDFTQDVFDLETSTSIAQLTASSGGINYLRKANTQLDATFNVDLPNNTYTLADNDLKINAMKLSTEGYVQIRENDDIKVDFKFDAPTNDFKNLLSLIPSAYTEDFSGVKADGKMTFNGKVKGIYNAEKEQLPAFSVKLDVDNGSFKYPELPMGMDMITAHVSVESPSSNLDQMKIDIPDFKFALDGKPFEGRFKLSTPISDPNIDTKVKGTLDLADINKAFPMDGVTQLSGIVDADIIAKARLSTIEKGDYENTNIDGKAVIANLIYSAEGLPKVDIKHTKIEFTPQKAFIEKFEGKLGKSDIQASGNIDNILAYFSPEKTMTGNITMTSNYFNVDEWMGEEETTTTSNVPTTDVEVFDRFKFNIDAKINKVDYDVYQLTKSLAKGSFSSNELKLDQFATNLGESDISGKGSLTNIFNYVFKNETLGGQMTIKSNFFDLNQFMEEEESVAAKTIADKEEFEPIIIPDNIDVGVNANIKKLVYTNLDLKDFSGKLEIKDSKVEMKDVEARTLGGKFVADGFYETQDPSKPKYNLTYDIKSFDFKNSFKQLNTIKLFAPVANYIEGHFSSKMSIGGVLGKDLIPEFNTIDADGFLQTADGFIKDFEPLKKIGEALNIKKLKSHKINLKGSKNWFEIKEGNVLVKDFPLSYQGIDMKIGGTHGIEQDIDYDILAKIPTNLIDKNAASQIAKDGLKLLDAQASKLGIKIDAGEFVNVKIKLTGTMLKPKVKFSLVGSEGQSVKDVIVNKIEEVKDTVVTKVLEVVDDKKEELEAKVQARKAALNKEADAKIASVMKTAEKSATAVKAEGKKAADRVRSEGYKQADLLVEKAGSNPFKKKAAQIAANKLKKETDKKADQVEATANNKADGLMKKAEDKSDQIKAEYIKKMEKVTVDNINIR